MRGKEVWGQGGLGKSQAGYQCGAWVAKEPCGDPGCFQSWEDGPGMGVYQKQTLMTYFDISCNHLRDQVGRWLPGSSQSLG